MRKKIGMMAFLVRYARPFRWIYAFCLVSTVAVSVIGYVLPVMQRSLINGVIGRTGSEVWIILLSVAVMMAAARGLESFSQLLVGETSQKVVYGVKRHFATRMLDLPPEFVRSLGGGYFAGRIYSDAEQLAMFYGGAVFSALSGLLGLVGGICLLFWLSAPVGFGALLAFPLYALSIVTLRGRYFKVSGQLSEATAASQRRMSDSINRYMLLKSHGAEDEASADIGGGIARETVFRIRKIRVAYLFTMLTGAVPLICQGLLVVVGVWMILRGDWTPGMLWALHCYLSLVFNPARRLCSFFMAMEETANGADRLMNLEGQLSDSDAGQWDGRLTGAVEFRGVNFSYGAEPVLREFNLKVAPGDRIRLSGPSGAGKSTLLALTLGLYRPDSGTVSVDGRDIRDWNLRSLRRQTGYISADCELVHGTLRRNLLLGCDEKVPDAEIFKALDMVGAGELARGLERGLDHEIYEGGSNFSTGERVRFALAREIIRKPGMLLVDESVGHLDRINAELFDRALWKAFSGRTIIRIEHGACRDGEYRNVEI
ncbi:MAG: ABC transporter ATP-binding protein/permease [Victivallaceae bacterium]|nr:ABC transporter ATP-binding protein/permease [Victivallaceae bacterium]